MRDFFNCLRVDHDICSSALDARWRVTIQRFCFFLALSSNKLNKEEQIQQKTSFRKIETTELSEFFLFSKILIDRNITFCKNSDFSENSVVFSFCDTLTAVSSQREHAMPCPYNRIFKRSAHPTSPGCYRHHSKFRKRLKISVNLG